MARAWLATAAIFTLVGLGLLAASRGVPIPDTWGFRGFIALITAVFATLGYLLARRRPENVIGWAFLIGSAVGASQLIAREYATLGAYGPDALPGTVWASWFEGWIWVVIVGGVVLVVPGLFPDGRPLSPRWRALPWIGWAGIASASLIFAFAPIANDGTGLPNPLGQEWLEPYLPGASAVTGALIVCAFVLNQVALVRRFRRGNALERQQLKMVWVAAAAAGLLFVLVAFFPAEKLSQIVAIFGILLVPASFGVAILRYGLYEIDVIINRALVYGALTAILAGVYSASIGLFQRLFVSITGEKSDAAIVVTTLLLAAVFTPLKTQLQSVVDARLKDGDRAVHRLDAFRDRVKLVNESLDARALQRSFMSETMAVLGARGATLTFAGFEERVGDPGGAPLVTLELRCDELSVGRLILTERARGGAYRPVEIAALQAAADEVARAGVLAERRARTT